MFDIQSGAKTKFKYEVLRLFTTERIYQSLNINCLGRRRVSTVGTNAYEY